MKTTLSFLTVLLSLGAAQGAEEINDVRVAITPAQSAADLDRSYRLLESLVYRDGSRGVGFQFIDGLEVTTFAKFTVPTIGPLNARKRQLRGDIAAIQRWFREAASESETNGESARLDVPEVLEHLHRGLGPDSVVLLIGSPVYFNRHEPGYSFFDPDEKDPYLQFRLPSHSHILTTPAGSVFGTEGLEGRLDGAGIHWWNPLGQSGLGTSLYRQELQRFWTLWVGSQHGRLLSIHSDGLDILDDLFRADLEPLTAAFDPAQTELAMRSVIRDVGGHHVFTNVVSRVSMAERSASPPASAVVSPDRSEKAALERFERAADEHDAGLSFGILWDQPCDLDLYLWEEGDVDPLYFDHPDNRHGTYLRDYGDSTDGDLEQIVMKHGITPQFEAWINVFEVREPLDEPITGKLIVRNNGRTRITPFTLQVREGNRGADRDRRNQSPYWQRLLYYSTDGGKRVAE